MVRTMYIVQLGGGRTSYGGKHHRGQVTVLSHDRACPYPARGNILNQLQLIHGSGQVSQRTHTTMSKSPTTVSLTSWRAMPIQPRPDSPFAAPSVRPSSPALTDSPAGHLDAEASVRVLLPAQDGVVVRLYAVLPVGARLPDRRQDAAQVDGRGAQVAAGRCAYRRRR